MTITVEDITANALTNITARIDVRCCCDCRLLGSVPAGGDRIRLVGGGALVLETYMDVTGHGEAYKSNDYPIEVLEKIPGWRAA